jgi:hypothetical protein
MCNYLAVLTNFLLIYLCFKNTTKAMNFVDVLFRPVRNTSKSDYWIRLSAWNNWTDFNKF